MRPSSRDDPEAYSEEFISVVSQRECTDRRIARKAPLVEE